MSRELFHASDAPDASGASAACVQIMQVVPEVLVPVMLVAAFPPLLDLRNTQVSQQKKKLVMETHEL